MDEILSFSSDTYFMGEALRQARKAETQDEVPIGAVIVRNTEIIARAWNQVEMLKDATAHAEMLAITQAESVVGDWRLDECELYVTKEPCPMCAGAIVLARLHRVIYGCPDSKTGGAGGMINLLQMPPLNHQCEITRGVRETECREILQRFFKAKREEEAERSQENTERKIHLRGTENTDLDEG
jgi:tRNA(adenine34) deaminase